MMNNHSHFKILIRLTRLFRIFPSLALAGIFMLSITSALAEETAGTTTITNDQMDAILLELKEIRKVLQKIEKQGGTRAAQKPSRPTTASISIEGRPVMGSADAPVTVVEFADYQCPYCLRFIKTTFPQLKKKYIDTGKVRWVALNLPLAFHKDARKAAQGALCAGEQDKFWEMRETLFKNPKKLSVEDMSGYAGDLSLDIPAFEACLNSERHLAEIDKDAQDAKSVRLTGTPSFVIGKLNGNTVSGNVVIGAQSLNVFESNIKKTLEQKPADK